MSLDKQVEEELKRIQQGAPNPLQEVLDDLVRDSEEPPMWATHER